MINTQIDPIKLQQILNKTPGKTVTAEEWNEVLNLLVAQGNLLMDNYDALNQTITSILNGQIDLTINVDATKLGGKSASEYALRTFVTESDANVKAWATTEINKKITKTYLYPNRVLVSGADSQILHSTATINDLEYLTTTIPEYIFRHNIEHLFLKESICGNNAYIQQETPTTNNGQPIPTGSIWISW